MTVSNASEHKFLVLNADGIKLDHLEGVLDAALDGYVPPPIQLMAPPNVIEALNDKAVEDEEIYQLLKAWADPKRRLRMHWWAFTFISDQLWYQAVTENTLYAGLYGPKGTGKSEIAMFLALLIIAVYQKYVAIKPILGFARSPSGANQVFANATQNKSTVALVLDETEKESGTGSGRELTGMIQNMDTMRELRHSMVVIAITKEELGSMLSRCEIVLRSIFKDRDNKVNWCILYNNDIDAKRLIPKAIVAIPLQPYDSLRKKYREWKRRSQVKLTSEGGSTGASSAKVVELADLLVDYAEEHGYTDYGVTQLEELLSTEIPGGSGVTYKEESKICNRARRFLDKRTRGGPPDEEDARPDIVWVGEQFNWRIHIGTALKESTDFPEQYYDIWYITEIEGLNPHKDRQKVEDLIGIKYDTVMKWKRRMDGDDKFQGWIKYQRGEVLFEPFLKKRLEDLGYRVEQKPTITIDGQEMEEDLAVYVGDELAFYCNAKTGTGLATYPATAYKTTYLLRNKLHLPAWIIYYDHGADVYSILDPAEEHINVGRKETRSLTPTKTLKRILGAEYPHANFTRIHSQPLLLRGALNGQVQVVGVEGTGSAGGAESEAGAGGSGGGGGPIAAGTPHASRAGGGV